MKPLNDNELARLISRLEREDDFVFLESARVSEENHQSLLFCSPLDRIVCLSDQDAESFLAEMDRLRRKGLFVAGWLSYEFGYLLEPRLHGFLDTKNYDPEKPLAVLGVYDEPFVYDHRTGLFKEGRPWPTAGVEESGFECSGLQTTLSRQQYLYAINAIKEYIRAGDTYQVNFTLHLDFQFQGSVGALYRALRRNQSVSYGAWIRQNGHDILSFSPELFFAADSNRIRVRPMKGTLGRGVTTAKDEVLSRQLSSDQKNRSENVMIVDLLRNDLGRLLHETGGGTVITRSMFDVEIYESLLQMTSTIDGLPSGGGHLPLSRIMSALFPCGSVTGAPKIRTMEIIHELEQQARGVYCGAIGYAGPEQSCFNVPIRTVELHGDRGRMGIGSGIVADSDPEAEWFECQLKGDFLTRSRSEFQLIETILWRPGDGFFLLNYHLDRLTDSARYFHFTFDQELFGLKLQEAVAVSKEQQRVRLLLYRDGRIEVTSTPCTDNQELPGLPEVIFSRQKIEPENPFLYHKTTRRSMYDSERNRAVEQGCFDVLFRNTHDQVTEGAITNLFIRRGGGLLTPPVGCGLLAGTYRRLLLEEGKAEEQVLREEDLLDAEEVYVANSIRGLVRVRLRQG